MNTLVYTCEIVQCVPEESGNDPAYQYCQGWRDYRNMDISIVGFAVNDEEPEIVEWAENARHWEDPSLMPVEKFIVAAAQNLVVGSRFDDRLLAVNGVDIDSGYDLLEEIRKAAHGSPYWQDVPHQFGVFPYSLGDLSRVNAMSDLYSRNYTAKLWQQGKKDKAIASCIAKIRVLRKLLALGLDGRLRIPTQGRPIELAPLPL